MNTKIINIDINKRYYGEIIAKQGDVASRFLLFKITDGAAIFNLTGRTVRAYAIKPDNSEVFNDLTITSAENGECKLELTSQMLAVQGTLLMELYIMEGSKKLTSIPFEIKVIKSINSEAAIVSTNEFTALINGLVSLNEYNSYKSEIATARGTYLNLDARLDAQDTSLAEMINEVYKNTNGWFKEKKTGLIIQWGRAKQSNINDPKVTVTFPIAFPVTMIGAFATGIAVNPNDNFWMRSDSDYKNYCIFRKNNTVQISDEFHWFAIGS